MATFVCRHCSTSLNTSLEQAIDHVHSHRLSEKPCVVPECGQWASKLTRHVKSSHPSLCRSSCNLCGRAFVKERSLKQHQRDTIDCTIKKKRKRGERNKRQNKKQDTVIFTSSYLANFYARFEHIRLTQPEIRNQTQPIMAHSAPANTVNFRDQVSTTDLNKFIDDNLQPTDEFNREMNESVEKICSFLREHMSPNEIVKGGSMGKGTAIKGKSDIDLVLVLNEVEDAKDLIEELPNIQENIINMLKENAESLTILPSTISTTHFHVKFTVRGTHGNIDVDLLPTFHFDDLGNLYEKMKNDQSRKEYYSASLVKQQVDFVSPCPSNVKNLIRLVKYWTKEMVPSGTNGRIPTSYVMELITIHLWEKNRTINGKFDALKAFHGVMKALRDYESLNVVWEKNYTKDMIPFDVKRNRPMVVDPANPLNNVCSRFEWREIGNAAREVLDSPMLREVTSISWS